MTDPTPRMYDIILKKREGGTLSAAEIRAVVDGYTRGDVPDYQMSALLMAIFFRGMSGEETAALVDAMVASGARVRLDCVPGVKVDKHSTGGVGDKTTLVVAPWVAACGLPVAKMSGRGLGHTGGTLDKLEALPGLRTDLSIEAFLSQLRNVGVVVAGQTGDLAPADKKLYALRDVTATVESVPLIAASVMSKKIASGADAFVLDVKVGRAAFMKDLPSARHLAREMVGIAKRFDRKAVAWLSAMDQPLGCAVGNLIEVQEAAATLRGEGPADLLELCYALGAEMLCLGGKAEHPEEARALLREALASGKAWEKLREMVAAQGGQTRALDSGPYPAPPDGYVVASCKATRSGVIESIDGLEVGLCAMRLGAGRRALGDRIDPHVGIYLRRKCGEVVQSGEAIADVIARDEAAANSALSDLERAYVIAEGGAPQGLPLLYERIASDEV